jgi:hypothetical protein
MTRLLLCITAVLALTTPASTLTPDWIPTGEWQCGPHVRVIVSSDGLGALDWYVFGAWFNNHYTLRRGQLFYNAIPCAAIGNVWPHIPRRGIVKDTDDDNQGEEK